MVRVCTCGLEDVEEDEELLLLLEDEELIVIPKLLDEIVLGATVDDEELDVVEGLTCAVLDEVDAVEVEDLVDDPASPK